MTPATDQTGTSTIAIQVSDGSLISTSSLVVTVAANQAPTISAIADQSVPENTATAALAFTLGDDATPVGSLILTTTSSHPTLIPSANIVLGGSGANRTVKIIPAAGKTGSSVITLQVSDGARITTTTLTLTVLPTLFADLADSAPRQVDGQTPSILTSTAADANLYVGRGGTGGTVDRCVVFPFRLPELGPPAPPFTAATLTFDLVSNNFSPTSSNVDLYGLATRNTPTVLASDYYSETNAADPTAGTTRLQDDLCTAATSPGLISTSAVGNTALVDFLNAQYAGGANAGKYVFLRLSKDTANGTNTKQYLVTSADGASAAASNIIWPRVSYTANTPPVISNIADQTLSVNESSGAIAFSVGDSQTAASSLTLSKSSSNPFLLPASGIVFGGSGSNRTLMLTPAADRLGTSTVTVTVSDGTFSMSETLVLTVAGTASETWRFNNFGTSANTGFGAESFDANGDGESNLLEFATNQDPNASTTASTPLVRNGQNLEFTYTRSRAAMADGVLFVVEWCDHLAVGIWNGTGVAEQILADNGIVQTVRATVSVGPNGRRFFHLRAFRP